MAWKFHFSAEEPDWNAWLRRHIGGEFADNRVLVFKNTSTKISFGGRVTIDGRPALRYEYDDPRGALAVTNDNQFGYTAARGAFWIDPETLDLLQIDIEGYAIPSNLAVRSISDSTMYWRVLIGKRIVLLPHNSEFRLTHADGTARRNASDSQIAGNTLPIAR